jgi:UDP-glucose:(heptosyl)LPS alpha-1,3-glucosyltransferase
VFCNQWSFGGDEKITFHKIPRRIKKPSVLGQILFSFACRKTVDDSFDIVHTHSRVTDFDVLTIHVPCFRSYITEEKNRLKKFSLLISAALSPRILSWFWLEKKQFAYKRGRLFIAVSEKIKKDVLSNYFLPNDDFRIAYPGVDSSIAKRINADTHKKEVRLKLGIGENDLVFLFVGTEFKRKGLDALLEGFRLICQDNTKLLVAGGGGGKIERYINLAARMGLRDHVHFLGLVEDVEELYAIADVFILPTLSDPAGMAPVEAMLAGVATIMSCPRYCGTAEHIKNGEALILKNPKDPNEIAEALQRLMDESFRNELRLKGQALASKLTWDETTANTLSTYYEVLQKKQV